MLIYDMWMQLTPWTTKPFCRGLFVDVWSREQITSASAEMNSMLREFLYKLRAFSYVRDELREQTMHTCFQVKKASFLPKAGLGSLVRGRRTKERCQRIIIPFLLFFIFFFFFFFLFFFIQKPKVFFPFGEKRSLTSCSLLFSHRQGQTFLRLPVKSHFAAIFYFKSGTTNNAT